MIGAQGAGAEQVCSRCASRHDGYTPTIDGRCTYKHHIKTGDRAGVLVLSEFAGAAQSLGAGAILANPWNITDLSAAIEDALTMRRLSLLPDLYIFLFFEICVLTTL